MRQWLDNVIGEVERITHGDDETKTNSFVAEKSMPDKKSKDEEAEKHIQETRTDKRKKIGEIFKLFDTTGNGLVNVDEFKEILRLLFGGDHHIDEKCANYFVAFFDENGDGKIDFEEFADIMLESESQELLELEYQPILLSFALKFGDSCLGNIDVLQFGPSPPLKCMAPTKEIVGYLRILLWQSHRRIKRKRFKSIERICQRKKEIFYLNHVCQSSGWLLSIHTGSKGKKHGNWLERRDMKGTPELYL